LVCPFLHHLHPLTLVAGSNFEKDTVVSQLAMVPLSKDHSANGIIEANRMLMVSGSLAISSFGNASTALFDGQSMIPFMVSAGATGLAGTIAALFHSFTFFSFDRRSQYYFCSLSLCKHR
jgi:hypothetical protein